MKVKIKKLDPNAIIPKYQTKGSACFDFHALEDIVIRCGETQLIKTGLAVSIPEGFELQVIPRSGMSYKTKLRVANSPGCVDSDFRGEICVIAEVIGNSAIIAVNIKKGDRIAQGKITPVIQAEFDEVEELDETERGSGGFGSTGK